MNRQLLIARRIPYDDWPDEDRSAYERAVSPGDIFTDPGPAAHLSESTKEGQIGTYGRWLRYLSLNKSNRLAFSGRPEDKAAVIDFTKNLQQRLKPNSVWSEIDRLHNFCFHAWPDRDWSWLREMANRLHREIPPRSLPVAQDISIDDLYTLGCDLMKRSSRIKPYRERDDSVMYRDGLMIVLLAVTVLRRKNLWQLRLDQELRCIEGHWVIRIDAGDMKNGEPYEMPLPEEIGVALETYLTDHRPRLLQGVSMSELWISKTGQAMTLNRVGQRVAQVTTRHLGKHVSAHMFRHIAATSISMKTPELAPLIRPLLGHTTSRTAEQYYNKASALAASRRVADNITALREQYQET